MRDATHQYVPKGSPLEVGMIEFLTENDHFVQEMMVRREREFKLLTEIPFCPIRKRMTVAYLLPEGNKVRVVCKGAPEYLVPMCTRSLNHFGEEEDFSRAAADSYLREIIANEMANKG